MASYPIKFTSKEKRPERSNLQIHYAFVLAIPSNLFAQQSKGKIHGQVLLTGNKPAENVTVVLKDTQNGTLTDEKGNYAFRVQAGTYTLIISHVGAQSKQLRLK